MMLPNLCYSDVMLDCRWWWSSFWLWSSPSSIVESIFLFCSNKRQKTVFVHECFKDTTLFFAESLGFFYLISTVINNIWFDVMKSIADSICYIRWPKMIVHRSMLYSRLENTSEIFHNSLIWTSSPESYLRIDYILWCSSMHIFSSKYYNPSYQVISIFGNRIHWNI